MLSQEIKRISPQEWKCQDITEEFDYPNKVILGAGTYGKVYKVQSKSNQQFYAVKCIKMLHEKEGVYLNIIQFPITSLREIKLLMSLNHENVIKINQIYTRSKRNKKRIKQIKTYCAMDIMAHDFFKVIKNNYDTKTFMTQNQVRSVLYQCFCGLQNIHENRIIHRDIKSANILMTFDGIVKIADFGLAKLCPKYEFIRKTPTVVTLSYRAPEVLLTRGNYDFLIDVWSMGIFAMELCLNKPIFKAKDDADQLRQIMELCGTPTEISWPEIIKSEYFIKIKPQMYPRKLISYIRNQKMDFDDELLDLLDKILVMNPQTRLDVNQILKHDYFSKHDLEECYCQLRDFVVNLKEEVKIVGKTKIFRDSPVKLKL